MNYDGTKVDNFYIIYEANAFKQLLDFYKLPFDSTLGVEDFENVSFAIYPNPNSGIINIESNIQATNIKIYSITGKLLHSQSLDDMRSIVNISSLTNGIYIAQVSLADGTTQKVKVIKQ